MSYAAKNLSAGSRELIAFRIGDQEFCVDIMSVREIRGWTPAMAMPHSPSYMRGVINLRGAVLPIIDLSARLGMRTTEPTQMKIWSRFAELMPEGGHLYIGHSERVSGDAKHVFDNIGITTYRYTTKGVGRKA